MKQFPHDLFNGFVEIILSFQLFLSSLNTVNFNTITKNGRHRPKEVH